MQVLAELKQRGVEDILICCVDGLKGFPEAIEAIFPNTVVQTCVVHPIRHSLKYVPRREREQVARDLKPIYTAVDADGAQQALVAERLGVRDPVPGVPARGQARDLHHECDRGPEPPAPQGDQDQRTLPQRGGRPQAHLPRRHQRRPGVDPNPELDDSAARVQDPLRRPPTRLNRLHRKSDALLTAVVRRLRIRLRLSRNSAVGPGLGSVTEVPLGPAPAVSAAVASQAAARAWR
jgi:hypothetical protein